MSDQAGYDYDDPVYQALQDEAKRDNRAGKHEWLVSSVVHDTWPNSGDERTKILGTLTTASGAKADLTLSPPPPPEVVKAEKASWSTGKLKAIANAVSLHKQLQKWYQKRPTQIHEGDLFRVETVITKRDADGKGGFVRVIAFLDPAGSNGHKKQDDDAPPF